MEAWRIKRSMYFVFDRWSLSFYVNKLFLSASGFVEKQFKSILKVKLNCLAVPSLRSLPSSNTRIGITKILPIAASIPIVPHVSIYQSISEI